MVPLEVARVTESTSQSVDLGHCRMKLETREIDLGRKNVAVTSLEVRQDARSWIRDREMMKGKEETAGRRCRELFQPLNSHHLAISDINASDEHVETIHNEGGVDADKFWHCDQVSEG